MLKHYGYIAYLRAVFLSVGEYYTINSKNSLKNVPLFPKSVVYKETMGEEFIC